MILNVGAKNHTFDVKTQIFGAKILIFATLSRYGVKLEYRAQNLKKKLFFFFCTTKNLTLCMRKIPNPAAGMGLGFLYEENSQLAYYCS